MNNILNIEKPKTLNEIFGHELIKDFLEKLIKKREFISIIFYGSTGTGKTSLAYAFCNDLQVTYSYFSAASGNKKELIELIDKNDYLIIDEIHRLNKDKQDLLLPAIEFGKIQIIAITTENPFFVVNPAVRSRTHMIEVERLTSKQITNALIKFIKMKNMKIKISKTLIENISFNANGDYRYALNILLLLNHLYKGTTITKKIILTIAPNMYFYFIRKSDDHYNLLSAFHKSLRGSDENAALYYLAKLIKSGDVLGIERRIVMAAYEDIGLANPNLALRVTTAVENVKKIGFPESRIILANVVIDICKSLKSNSAYMAINSAYECLSKGNFKIPEYLKNNHYIAKSKGNYQIKYKNPHEFGGYIKNQYLPNEIKNEIFYKKNKNDKL